MAVSNQFLEHLNDLHQQSGANETWLSDQQEEAWKEYLAQSIPTSKLEAWKYSTLPRYLASDSWASLSPALSVKHDDVESDVFTQHNNAVVICSDGSVNTRSIHPKISVNTSQNLSTQQQSQWLSWLEGQKYFKEDGVNALNMALSKNCVFIEVKAGAVIDVPLQLITFLNEQVKTQPQGACLVNTRVFIKVNAGAKLTLREMLLGELNCDVVSNQTSQITLGERACLDHTVLQKHCSLMAHINKHQIIALEKSEYKLSLLAAGGGLNRQEFHVCLKGSHAKASLQGVSVGSDNEKLDVQILIEHEASETSSSQCFNGLFNEQAQGIFNGRVHVKSGQVNVVSEQVNHNLLLSDLAQINTKPELVIHTDEVKCTHGATVGRLDDNALFYLQSRGLSAYQAKELLTQAFIQTVLDKMNLSPEESHRALSVMTQALHLT